jgi:Trk K+ transport system NAD-binding subunit
MKTLSTQIATFLSTRDAKRNLRSLLRFMFGLLALIAVYTILFHVIMDRVEGREFSWFTGLYWTLTVMSTLGFGDITFTSDTGRVFSVVVLMSGMVLLLVMMPFMFIHNFYAPWLEARIRARAPKGVPDTVQGHVLIAGWDMITPVLIPKLERHRIPYYVMEPDAEKASRLNLDGVSVLNLVQDARQSWEAARVAQARLVFANDNDPDNTNITITVREITSEVPIVALASHEDSIDILEMSGATQVVALGQVLGEYLAHRVNARAASIYVLGAFRDQLIAEMPVQGSRFDGLRIRDTQLRDNWGVTVVGVWERGRLLPAHPSQVLDTFSVPLVMGSKAQIEALNASMGEKKNSGSPVLVIGGGRVGTAAATALRKQGVQVHLLERDGALKAGLEQVPDRLFIGDAADREELFSAGLKEAPAVVLTTHDDALNIYLSVYCRKLRPDIRIVSRITHERNLEAITRAGANFVLSEASLGSEIVFSRVLGREMVVLGEGVELFYQPTPGPLEGQTLAESGIGAKTGLAVIAIEEDGRVITNPSAQNRLVARARLIMIGSPAQRLEFAKHFEGQG